MIRETSAASWSWVIAGVGLLLWIGQVSGLLWIAAFALWIDRLQIPAEEQALTGLFGTLLTQVDKIILARVLPLEQYGYFTLAMTIAGA